MGKLYYNEEFECYLVGVKNVDREGYMGVVILSVKGLNNKQIINKILDNIDDVKYSKHYKEILKNLFNEKN